MKLPVAKIAAWIGRTLLTAAISAAADRLSRPKVTPKPAADGPDQAGGQQDSDQRRLDPA